MVTGSDIALGYAVTVSSGLTLTAGSGANVSGSGNLSASTLLVNGSITNSATNDGPVTVSGGTALDALAQAAVQIQTNRPPAPRRC